jgi:hypothetical protein
MYIIELYTECAILKGAGSFCRLCMTEYNYGSKVRGRASYAA